MQREMQKVVESDWGEVEERSRKTLTVAGEQQEQQQEQQQNGMFGHEQGDRTLEGNSTQEQKVEMSEDGRRRRRMGGVVGGNAAGRAIRLQCSRCSRIGAFTLNNKPGKGFKIPLMRHLMV